MSDEEKKDISDPRINYRNDWAEKHGERNEAANEKSNQAQGKKVERVRDAESGKVKSFEKLIEEGKEQKGKTFADRVGKKEPVHSKKGITDPHLKSTTALTDPETAKQNLKDASKAQNFGKENPPSRGGFRGGGSPMMREPDEILKEKHKNTNPEDILSHKKTEKPFEIAMNTTEKVQPEQQKQESQPQQAKHKSSLKASLDAKVQELIKKQEKAPAEITVAETVIPKREGIKAEIARKVEELKKSPAEKSNQKTPKPEKTTAPPKPILKDR